MLFQQALRCEWRQYVSKHRMGQFCVGHKIIIYVKRNYKRLVLVESAHTNLLCYHDCYRHHNQLSTQVANTQLMQASRRVAWHTFRAVADLCNRYGLLCALRNSCNISRHCSTSSANSLLLCA